MSSEVQKKNQPGNNDDQGDDNDDGDGDTNDNVMKTSCSKLKR